MKIHKMNEGIRYAGDSEFVVDMKNDYDDDIINTVIDSELYYSNFRDNVYYFGYKFKDSASRKERSEFIDWLKSKDKLDNVLREFINRPLIRLERENEINNIELVVYPDTRHNKLTRFIIESLYAVTKGSKIKSISIVKNTPSEIEVDYDALLASSKDTKQYEDRKVVVNSLLDKIHSLEYFSFAKNVKVKYRPYIVNYLKFNKDEIDVLTAIEYGNVLIIDDVNTSGSTLNEVINQIQSINKNCKIYIYTLLGK